MSQIVRCFRNILIKKFLDANLTSKKNKEPFDLSKYSVSIFGSCVSRDLLEFEKQNNFSLVNYFARCSIVSAVSAPIIIHEDEIALTSSFQRRQIEADLNKKVWEELKCNKSDYLLVDFIDERFSIGKYQDSYFTLSNEMYQSNCIKEYTTLNKEKQKNRFYLEDRDITEFLDEFWNRILEIYAADKIILHKAKLTNYYVDLKGNIKKFSFNHLRNNQRLNELLDYMYTYSEKKLGECIVVSVERDCYADESHKWGLAPMHYRNEYYLTVLKKLNNFLN